jgi:hypothetical protein
MLQPVIILPVAGLPDLPPLLVAAFGQEDIAATLVAGESNFIRLNGRIDGSDGGRSLHWQVVDPDGSPKGEISRTLPQTDPDAAQLREIAAWTAAAVAHIVRSDDTGALDLAARPKIAVDQVNVIGPLDGGLLKRALVDALQQKGLAVVSEQPQMRVSGSLRITPGLGGHDLVEVTWVVTDDKGDQVGKVNQGSPVTRDDLVSRALQMTHQIADGGADGIAQLVHTKL